jgi:hypothetical protein
VLQAEEVIEPFALLFNDNQSNAFKKSLVCKHFMLFMSLDLFDARKDFFALIIFKALFSPI